MEKPVHAKPSLYAYYFLSLKEIALKYGYNLVLHGSLHRDLDLVAIPWQKELGNHESMINEFVNHLGGSLMLNMRRIEGDKVAGDPYTTTHHGRMQYVININRGDMYSPIDPQYYLDISVMPGFTR